MAVCVYFVQYHIASLQHRERRARVGERGRWSRRSTPLTSAMQGYDPSATRFLACGSMMVGWVLCALNGVWGYNQPSASSTPGALSVAIVVVRFREPRSSLEWVAQLHVHHRIVINKGVPFSPALDQRLFKVLSTANVGREDYSYLDFMLHHALRVRADLFVFTQPELRDYEKTAERGAAWVERLRWADLDNIASGCFSCLGRRVPYMHSFDDPPPRPFTTEPRSRYICPEWPWARFSQTTFCPGETIAVSRFLIERIIGTAEGRQHVRAVRDEILSYGEGNPTGGYIMERSWQLLWHGPNCSHSTEAVVDCLRERTARTPAANLARRLAEGIDTAHSPTSPQRLQTHLIECPNEVASYAGAYLVTSPMLLTINFADAPEGEPGSGLRLFDPKRRAAQKLRVRGVSSGRIRRPAFFVEHLSGLDFSIRLSRAEHSQKARSYLAQTSADQAARACARATSRAHASPRPLARSVALLPFWDGRNNITHNAASRATVVDRLYASMCAAAIYFEEVVVGACSDLGEGTRVLEQHGIPPGVRARLVSLTCGSGAFLIYRLLRHAQGQLRAGRWHYEYVFYSEADQVVHLEGVEIATLATVLTSHSADGRPVYINPNRLEEIYEPGTPKLREWHGDRLPYPGPDVQWDNRTFATANMCE